MVRLDGHVRETVRLAVPVMIARSGLLLMVASDVIMTGHAGAGELAAYALSFGMVNILYVLGLGALSSTTVLAAQADGLGHPERCGTVWRIALLYGLALGLVFAGLAFGAEWFFRLTGQSPALAASGAATAHQFALGLPPVLMYLATAMFLEGIGRPTPNMVLMIGANGLNVALNGLFIYDHALPALAPLGGMGAAGAALATSLTRWAMFAVLAAYVLAMRSAEHYGVRGPLHYPLDLGRKLRRLGLPIGLAHGLETGAFTTVILFAGQLGAIPLAIYQIASNMFSLVYMLAIGLATATSVRVGNAVGRGDPHGLVRAGWVSAGLGLAVMTALCWVFIVFPRELVALYTQDEAVLALAVTVLSIAGIFLILDGGQGVMLGALRGLGDIWIPSAMVQTGFWGVTVPLGRYLAFSRGMGVPGLFWALCAGALTAWLLLLLRFARVSRREIRPV